MIALAVEAISFPARNSAEHEPTHNPDHAWINAWRCSWISPSAPKSQPGTLLLTISTAQELLSGVTETRFLNLPTKRRAYQLNAYNLSRTPLRVHSRASYQLTTVKQMAVPEALDLEACILDQCLYAVIFHQSLQSIPELSRSRHGEEEANAIEGATHEAGSNRFWNLAGLNALASNVDTTDQATRSQSYRWPSNKRSRYDSG